MSSHLPMQGHMFGRRGIACTTNVSIPSFVPGSQTFTQSTIKVHPNLKQWLAPSISTMYQRESPIIETSITSFKVSRLANAQWIEINLFFDMDLYFPNKSSSSLFQSHLLKLPHGPSKCKIYVFFCPNNINHYLGSCVFKDVKGPKSYHPKLWLVTLGTNLME
jgi:hypothetical protein